MERRIYFILGDLAACLTAGALAGWLVHLILPGGWPLIALALAGMIIGMTIGIFTSFLFTPFFGALEIMLPTSIAGGLAGMGVGMAMAMTSPGAFDAALIGASMGFLSLAYVYLLQIKLHGEVG